MSNTEDRDAFVERWARRIATGSAVFSDECRDFVRALLAEYDASRAEQPLTVGAALMLPEVRSGAKWIGWTRPGQDPDFWENQIRILGTLVVERVRGTGDNDTPWSLWDPLTLHARDLDAPCTLVDPHHEDRP